MRLRIEATPEELATKQGALLKSLIEKGAVNPEWIRLPVNEFFALRKSDEFGEPTIRRMSFRGLPINIENLPGSVRYWGGVTGNTLMQYVYGEIDGTMGADGDPYDVYVGPHEDAPEVYVMHQQVPETGEYDEDKAFLGFQSVEEAYVAYHEHYDGVNCLQGVSILPFDEFAIRVRQTKSGKIEMLSKGGSGSTRIGDLNPSGQINSHLGNRAVNTGGAMNIAFMSPPGPSQAAPVVPGYKQIAQELRNRRPHNQRELRRYQIEQNRSPQRLPLVPVELPKLYRDAHEDARKGAKKRMKIQEDKQEQRYENTLDAPARVLDAESTAKYYVKTSRPE